MQFEIRSLRTERVGSDSGGEVARFFFLEVARNTDLKGKTDVENMQFKATFLWWERSSQMPGQNTLLMQPILHPLRLISIGVPRSIDFLRDQSSSACFLPANRPVERSKLVFAVCSAVVPVMRLAIRPVVVPAVAHPNKFISKNSGKTPTPNSRLHSTLTSGYFSLFALHVGDTYRFYLPDPSK